MIDIAIIRSNSIVNFRWVGKIVRSLSKRYSTIIRGWNREGVSLKTITNYIADLKLWLKSIVWKAISNCIFSFILDVDFLKLFVCRSKAVYACGLDTIYLVKSTR
jgi:hypothetical protein